MTEITLEAPVTMPAQSAPEPTAPEVVAAVDKIVKEALRRPATLDALMTKKRRERDVVVASVDEDGNDVELVLRYRALSAKEFDDLIAQYPPNPKQKAEGQPYNPDTFGPALVAACCISPKMTVEEYTTLKASGVWSAGEVATLEMTAFDLCQTAAGVPFTVRG